MLDVFFLSHGEANADENWQHLKSLCPRAQRIDGIDGLFEAHQACAQASNTANFWVVDADAWIFDHFDFSYMPKDIMHWDHAEKDSVLIWSARNPVNGLEYGYGGVKLFPKKPFLDGRAWRIDLATTLSAVVINMPEVAGETRFNSTPKSAWVGAFRECAKLASLHSIKQRIQAQERMLEQKFKSIEQYIDQQGHWSNEEKGNYRRAQQAIAQQETQTSRNIFSYWPEIELCLERYGVWTRYGWFEKHGPQTIRGAREGARYGLINSDNAEALDLINDWTWLEQQYQAKEHA